LYRASDHHCFDGHGSEALLGTKRAFEEELITTGDVEDVYRTERVDCEDLELIVLIPLLF
jgi:hypothetical protein